MLGFAWKLLLNGNNGIYGNIFHQPSAPHPHASLVTNQFNLNKASLILCIMLLNFEGNCLKSFSFVICYFSPVWVSVMLRSSVGKKTSTKSVIWNNKTCCCWCWRMKLAGRNWRILQTLLRSGEWSEECLFQSVSTLIQRQDKHNFNTKLYSNKLIKQ